MSEGLVRVWKKGLEAAHHLHLTIVPTFLSHPQPLYISRPCFPHHTACFCPEPMLLPCPSVPLPALLSKRSAPLWCHPHTALSIYPTLLGTLPLCAKPELLRTTAETFLQVAADPVHKRSNHFPQCHSLPSTPMPCLFSTTSRSALFRDGQELQPVPK